MRVDGMRYELGELILTTGDMEAKRLVYDFRPGEYLVKRTRKKRSLDANAYAWVLIDKLAEALRYTKEQVYRDAVKDIGGNSDTVCVKAAAAEKLCSAWAKKGLGWQADIFDSKIPGCKNIVLYYGSSVYDTRQMSLLIDSLIQDCKALGIETLPPHKLAAMLEGWE